MKTKGKKNIYLENIEPVGLRKRKIDNKKCTT